MQQRQAAFLHHPQPLCSSASIGVLGGGVRSVRCSVATRPRASAVAAFYPLPQQHRLSSSSSGSHHNQQQQPLRRCSTPSLAAALRGSRLSRGVSCRASSPDQQQQPSSSSSSSSQGESAATPQQQQVAGADAATTPAVQPPLTVEAVQSDPAATIEAIQRLTQQPGGADNSSTSTSASSSTAAAAAGEDAQQQQSAFDAFVAAVAAAWAGVQVHWQSLLGFCAAALAAVKASLGKFPAWVAAQKLSKLQEAADAAPTDAGKQAAYLAALNSNAHPREVLARVESKAFSSNPAVVVEYLKALVATERLNEYADHPSAASASSSSTSSTRGSLVGVGALPAPGQDHRSLLALLKELQGLAGGGPGASGSEAPGSSLRRPLHVVLQGPGIPKVSKVAGPFRALWNLVGVLTLLMGLSAAWLVGSQALRSAAAGQFGGGVGAGSSSGIVHSAQSSGAAAGAGASAASSSGPAIEPKEYKREEMPEKSIRTFADVLGCDESKAELQEVVEFLKDPDKFTRLGAKLPRGVLLTGPPGTGKTLLARAVAGEAGVPFFYRAGSEFEELYVGVGSRRMRALFGAAKKKAPCIVFIDEIDAIGGNRKHWENHTRKTLNQLLVEMDGFEANEGVIVMAATNLPETLDPALKRPGRFDRQVAVPLPDVKGRADILGHYLKDKPVAPGLDTALLARQTSGFSGADLANLVNEAALLAAKRGADAITPDMVDYAYDKVLMGVERKSAVRSPEALKRTAYHEGGHALVALSVPGASPVHKATIVPRGHALGMVTQVGREDEFSINRQQMIARILVSMGGTVAEELVFGRDQVSSGATDDLRQATNMARHMVMQCGLNDAVGPVYVDEGDMKTLSEGLRQQIDEEVRSILMSARAQVKTLLTERLDQLHALAGALVEHETLNSGQIKAVLAGEKLAPALLHLGLDSSSTQPDAAAAAGAGAAADDVAAGAALDDQ